MIGPLAAVTSEQGAWSALCRRFKHLREQNFNMSGRFIKAMLLAVVLSLSFSQAVRAHGSATATPSGAPAHKHHHPIQFILNHAVDLNLTDAQKSKLEALRAKIQQHHARNQASGTGQTSQHHHWLREQIEKILTAAQVEKLKALLKQCHQNHAGK